MNHPEDMAAYSRQIDRDEDNDPIKRRAVGITEQGPVGYGRSQKRKYTASPFPPLYKVGKVVWLKTTSARYGSEKSA